MVKKYRRLALLKMTEKELLKDILYSVLIGDALGVPYEFRTREIMKKFPANDMVGCGTHNQPSGTFRMMALYPYV